MANQMFNKNPPTAMWLPLTLLAIGIGTGNTWVIGCATVACLATMFDL